LASERDAALAKVAALEADVQTLTEAREYLERNIGELEDRRDADEAHVADLELALSEARLGHDAADMALAEKTIFHRAALSVVQRLKVERDNLRQTIATQQTRIDGLTAAACDVAPQLLRDSMRVTQEENVRLRAEVSALTAKGITFEAALSRHHESHARTVQERNTCMERMDALRADLAKVTGERDALTAKAATMLADFRNLGVSYHRVRGEREACAADVTALRKQLYALRNERDALAKERPSARLERIFAGVEEENTALKSEITTLTTRATAAEGYAQHLLAALNAVSGFKGMP
jgi:chromosome segregation ATPase